MGMARAWCILKPGGRALIGVPSGPTDRVTFNKHKLYGPVMLPHLFANFKQIYSTLDYNYQDEYSERWPTSYQPLYVVEKSEQ